MWSKLPRAIRVLTAAMTGGNSSEDVVRILCEYAGKDAKTAPAIKAICCSLLHGDDLGEKFHRYIWVEAQMKILELP